VTDLVQVVEIDPGAVTDLVQVVVATDQARDRNQPQAVVATDPVQWIENQAQRKDRVQWIDRDRVAPSVANVTVEALHRGTVNVVR
jgi:hypothetical protein